jgi:hypothetical protein
VRVLSKRGWPRNNHLGEAGCVPEEVGASLTIERPFAKARRFGDPYLSGRIRNIAAHGQPTRFRESCRKMLIRV